MRKDEKAKWNEWDTTKSFDERIHTCLASPQAKFREEAYLQVFKELFKNKTKD